MKQINKVELQGHVGTVRIIDINDKQVLHFSLATNYGYESKNNSQVVETTWHNVVAWKNEKMPDFKRISSGTPLNVTGRIRKSKYTNVKGEEKDVCEILADTISIVKD